MILFNGVLAPLTLPLRAAFPLPPPVVMNKFMLPRSLGPNVQQKDVVLVNPPIASGAPIALIQRTLDGLPCPRHLRVLASNAAPLLLSRPDARTLVVRRAGGLLERLIDGGFF